MIIVIEETGVMTVQTALNARMKWIERILDERAEREEGGIETGKGMWCSSHGEGLTVRGYEEIKSEMIHSTGPTRSIGHCCWCDSLSFILHRRSSIRHRGHGTSSGSPAARRCLEIHT